MSNKAQKAQQAREYAAMTAYYESQGITTSTGPAYFCTETQNNEITGGFTMTSTGITGPQVSADIAYMIFNGSSPEDKVGLIVRL